MQIVVYHKTDFIDLNTCSEKKYCTEQTVNYGWLFSSVLITEIILGKYINVFFYELTALS